MKQLTQFELKHTLDYDPNTGLFKRKIYRSPNARVGDIAGTVMKQGHVRISLNGSHYMAHRLAWLFVTGDMPKYQVDHINGIKTDNRFENLRDVSPKLNSQNARRPHKDNKTGYLGVCSRYGKFVAQLLINDKQTVIGYFDTAEEAHLAYIEKKRTYHEGCTL